jgi:hypothetical protein
VPISDRIRFLAEPPPVSEKPGKIQVKTELKRLEKSKGADDGR